MSADLSSKKFLKRRTWYQMLSQNELPDSRIQTERCENTTVRRIQRDGCETFTPEERVRGST